MSTLDFSNLCRICLTRTVQMIPLKSYFNETLDTKTTLNITDALKTVLNFSPQISECYPQFICSMCLDVLKTAYNFKILFEESHLIIQQYLGESEEKIDEIKKIVNLNDSKASVELIAGSNKYNLNDLVIVEDEIGSSDEINFQGFLSNLGKSVTATFVDNNKIKDINPIEIEIRRLSTSYESVGEDSSSSPLKTRNRSNSLDEYILIEGEKAENVETDCVKYSENDIKNLEMLDKDLLESALNLKYTCNVCKKMFVSEIRYKKHSKLCGKGYKIRKDNKRDEIITRFQCHYCKRTFGQRKYLTYHIKMSHKSTQFSCDICNVKLKSKRSYSYHKLTKHSDAQHICQYCGKKFAVAASLKLHIDIHTNRDTPQCICPVCGKTFHYKGGLFYHMKQHTNERKYQCEYCVKNFYTLFAKQRHVRTHTGIRPYECRFCEKRFFSLGERKRHEYIHTGTLPYRCEYCDKGFTSKYNLKVHWFNHSGDFNCVYCNRRFIDNQVLEFHYKMKHKDMKSEDSQ